MAADLPAHLQALLARVPGGRAAVLADRDGIALASACREATLEVDVLAARYAIVLRDLRTALDRLGQGEPSQVLVELSGATLVIFPLKERFGLYLIVAPGQALGRGLFEARKTIPALEASL
jgi:predicted regulator of Ras-like GTPase activity (Roadblock/LC7/MglB family)